MEHSPEAWVQPFSVLGSSLCRLGSSAQKHIWMCMCLDILVGCLWNLAAFREGTQGAAEGQCPHTAAFYSLESVPCVV